MLPWLEYEQETPAGSRPWCLSRRLAFPVVSLLAAFSCMEPFTISQLPRAAPAEGEAEGEARRRGSYEPVAASATGRFGSAAWLRCRPRGTSLRNIVASSAATRI